jgi:hypothetical protein
MVSFRDFASAILILNKDKPSLMGMFNLSAILIFTCL